MIFSSVTFSLIDSSSIDGSSEASESPASVRRRKNLSLVCIQSIFVVAHESSIPLVYCRRKI